MKESKMKKLSIAFFFASLNFMLPPLALAISSPNESPSLNDFDYKKSSNYPEFSIVGSWSYKAPSSSCEDTYTFQPDGTMRGTSGNQVVDSTYTISETHTQYAFYELKHKVVSTNNQKDCDSEPSEIGHEGLHFIRYDLTGEHMIMCEDETSLLYNCFGPLTRSK